MQIYSKVESYMASIGPELQKHSGSINDIGVTKKYLTEYDIRIEKDLKTIIKEHADNSVVFAEEQNRNLDQEIADIADLWVIDPISGTKWFINGYGNYCIVATHVQHGSPVYSAVYDPTCGILYTAQSGVGIKVNGKQVVDCTTKHQNIILQTKGWLILGHTAKVQKVWGKIFEFDPVMPAASYAYTYILVALGHFAGIVSLSQDNFPDFAGQLFIKESGKYFSTLDGRSVIGRHDNAFIAADTRELHEKLLRAVCGVLTK